MVYRANGDWKSVSLLHEASDTWNPPLPSTVWLNFWRRDPCSIVGADQTSGPDHLLQWNAVVGANERVKEVALYEGF
jgi:hypothetical protein